MTSNDIRHSLPIPYRLDDDDDPDFDDEDDSDEDGEDEDEDEENGEPDEETWQVTNLGFPLKSGERLTSGAELPRLSAEFVSLS